MCNNYALQFYTLIVNYNLKGKTQRRVFFASRLFSNERKPFTGKVVKMPEHAFIGGVKPGGLTTDTEIKILICYLIKSAPCALSQKDIEDALLNAELVNYFELTSALVQLCEAGHIKEENGVYSLCRTGESFADILSGDLPGTVRERALDAVIKAQRFNAREKQHSAKISPYGEGFLLECEITELGKTIFKLQLAMPDIETAQKAKELFIENGADVFTLCLAGLCGDKNLAENVLSRFLQ